jgi:opacity protein-like surface antigen
LKKFLNILTISILIPLFSFAQYSKSSKIDVGIMVGGSYYIGDLNSKQFQFTKPAGGIVFRYCFNKRAAIRANLLMGSITASDSYSDSQWQRDRNLDFKSSITELSTQFEFNFLNYKIGGNDDQNFSPYIFMGLAGFHFNPQGQTANGQWVALQPLSTEGEGLPAGSLSHQYKLTQVSIPFGVGFKTGFSKNMCVGFEWGMRKTFTDYLDDVSSTYYSPAILTNQIGSLSAAMADKRLGKEPTISDVGTQRGNPGNKDWYSFFGIVLTIRINKSNSCAGALKMGGG